MDGPHRRTWRLPGARLLGAVAALALLLAVLALPPASSAFSAMTGTPANSMAADRLQPPPGLTATQTCSPPIAKRGALASVKVTPLQLSPPTGTQKDDVLVAQVAYYGTSPITAPVGWNRISLPDSSGGVVTSAVYWKVAADNEPVATFTRSDTTTGDMVGGIVAYSGVNTSAPVDTSGGATGAGDTATSPALTTAANGAVAVHLMTRSGVQPATPDSRELWARSSDSETVTAFDERLAGSGAVPQRSSTTSGSTTAWIAQTVVLRPALWQVGATLSWTPTPSSSWADGYKGERVTGGTVFGPITVPLTPRTFTDTSLVNGTTYTYRVWAYRGAWVSDKVVVTLTPSC